MKGEMVPGSVRNGGGLLVGLLRCGHCGRKLKVQHNGLRGVARYLCNDANVNHGRRTKCIAFGNMRIDAAVSAEVMLQIAPLGLDAAPQAIADRERAGAERLQQIELALEQARYEAARAHRQYDAVDPENRGRELAYAAPGSEPMSATAMTDRVRTPRGLARKEED